jgi:hypothetical protein
MCELYLIQAFASVDADMNQWRAYPERIRSSLGRWNNYLPPIFQSETFLGYG